MIVYGVVLALLAYVFVMAGLTSRARPALAGTGYYVKAVQRPDRPRRGRVAALAAGAILIGVAALRWEVGTDYISYLRLYEVYVATDLTELLPWQEPGIVLLARLAGLVNSDPALLLGITSVVTVGIAVFTMWRDSKWLGYSMFLYVLLGCWQLSFNAVRQGVAIAILFWAAKFVLERRFWPFLAAVLVATMFHISAAVGIFLFFVPRRPLGLLGVLTLIAAAVGLTGSYAAVGSAYEAIRSREFVNFEYLDRRVNPARVLLGIAPGLLYLLMARASKYDARVSFYGNMAILHGALWVASAGSAYLARFTGYTEIFLTIGIPAVLSTLKSAEERVFLGGLILSVYAVSWYLVTSAQPALVPFQWVFQR